MVNKEAKLTIDVSIEDTLALGRILKKDYGISRVILVGHSWGALLGVLAVQKAPELFECYIGMGQLVSNTVSEPLSLKFCKKRALELDGNRILGN